jgi:hydroxyacylglutathione hydrolase
MFYGNVLPVHAPATRRRMRRRPMGACAHGKQPSTLVAMDVRMFTVGPVQENCYIARRDGASRAVIVDPGEEAPKLLGALEALGVELDAILLTHTHFDHVGAVAPVARATGAEVWVPEAERGVLADIMRYVPWEGFGPYESWEAEHTVSGGEKLELAGFEIDVIFTPGHSPGHVTYSIPDEAAIFSGDVLFQQSVGRTDLPGGDWPTLLESIRGLVDSLPPQTAVYPCHMGITSLGAERATNPFLAELARS